MDQQLYGRLFSTYSDMELAYTVLSYSRDPLARELASRMLGMAEDIEEERKELAAELHEAESYHDDEARNALDRIRDIINEVI